MTAGLLTMLLPTALAGVVQGNDLALDQVYEPRRVAVLVGVQDYGDPALQGLRFAAKDARDLGSALGDPFIGDFDRVVVIEGQQATSREGILHALGVATADLQRDDTFLLYMSGHGTLTLDPRDGSRLWFLPSDGQLESPEQTGLAVSELEEMVNELPARRRVLVLDTCHNGRSDSKSNLNGATASLLQGFRGEPPAPRNLREVSESEARLYAAQYYQPAMEDPELENGVYTHFLLSALTDQAAAADLDRDGLVDVAEAHDHARDKTIAHTGGLQVPRAEYRIVGREEIYLSGDPNRRSVAEMALISACDQILAKAKLLVDGIPRGSLPGLTAIEPGRHELEVQTEDGRTLARQTVNLEAGHTLPIESIIADDRRSRVMVAAGASVRHGEGWESFHPFAGELELAWIDPVRLPTWLRSDAHLRVSAASGTVAEQLPTTSVFGGFAAGGLSLGLRGGPISVGPLAELVVPWRTFTNETGSFDQAGLTWAGGGRVLWTQPVGAAEIAVRIDSRYVPFSTADERSSLWHHGVALGFTTGR